MHSIVSRQTFAGILGLVLATALLAAAQQQPAPPPSSDREGKPAEQVYKNIQVLQGTPAEDLIQAMHLIRASLGVDCEYCHVSTQAGRGAEKDDLEAKRTARTMIKMVRDINKNQFGGAQLVTCFTCHRGSTIPVTAPILPVTYEPEKPGPDLPTAEQIFSKYVQALGGEQAIRKVTSRVITANEDIPTGGGGAISTPSQMEQCTKTPNLILNVYHTDKFTVSDGFDGAYAWVQNMNGMVAAPIKLDGERVKRNANFYDSLNLKGKYSQLSVDGVQKVNGRDAYVVTGIPADDNAEELYFDTQTGLLLRKTTSVSTAIGDSPMEVDYDDYRDTGSGVKVPFLIHMYPANQRTELQSHSTIQVLKVQDNVAIDNSKFVRPPSKPAPPPAQ